MFDILNFSRVYAFDTNQYNLFRALSFLLSLNRYFFIFLSPPFLIPERLIRIIIENRTANLARQSSNCIAKIEEFLKIDIFVSGSK